MAIKFQWIGQSGCFKCPKMDLIAIKVSCFCFQWLTRIIVELKSAESELGHPVDDIVSHLRDCLSRLKLINAIFISQGILTHICLKYLESHALSGLILIDCLPRSSFQSNQETSGLNESKQLETLRIPILYAFTGADKGFEPLSISSDECVCYINNKASLTQESLDWCNKYW